MKKILIPLVFIFSIFAVFSQSVELSYSGSRSYALTERTDLRRYENGKYIGLTSREVRSFINPTASYEENSRAAKESWFDGNFYVTEETKTRKKVVGDGIYDSIPSVFHIAPNGVLTMYEDNGFPSFRSFPAFPSKKINIGDSWTAQAERAVDPNNDGKLTRLKIDVRYTLVGEGVFNGQEIYKIKAIWQTLYGMSWNDPKGDPNLVKAQGGHKAEISVLKSNGSPILVTDNVDETFIYRDGKQVSFKGTISLFTKYPPALNSDKILAAFGDIATVKEGEKTGPKPMGGGSTGSISTVEKSDKTSADSKNEKTDAKTSSDSKKGKNDKTSADSGKKSKVSKDEKKDSAIKKSDQNEKTDSKTDSGSKNDGQSDKVAANNSGSSDKSKDSATENKTLEVQLTAAKNDMIVEETSAGIRLTIQNLQFQPDSAELVPGLEGNRLDEIAKVLKMAPDSQILVEGHTAAVGKPAGELSLSQERARKIANELVSRGIPAKNLIVRGWGGTKPVAPNDTNAGRALNRRVEITILQ